MQNFDIEVDKIEAFFDTMNVNKFLLLV